MVDKLKALKEKSRMTNQQIAEKSGIPESTIARIFSGKTPNPTIISIVSIVKAMGGSAADFFDNIEQMDLGPDNMDIINTSSVPSSESSTIVSDNKNELKKTISDDFFERYHNEVITMYKSAIYKKEAWIKRLFWCLVMLVCAILFILLFDILNPNVGYVRY